ncbi:hypothetical protein [Catenuloplanes atrovinosus]|uniref:Secreted protein n=1 Tax=Catenuloplanes atrovinosus TaxID=137266 RepID=A0AAE3YM38_9ACTN|nr:hypothetical protein [Catenuloplanes atrovinosus]MDR7274713.1 hypothetical protein [Catenuloplanes atrovinosus]
MTRIRRLTLLVLPLALSIFVASPASAAPAKATAASLARAALHRSVAAAPPNLPSYVTNSVGNSSIIAVGVIGQKDGVYKVPGKYDERLQPQMWSHSQFGWNTTGGWYTGPGYCTAQMRSDDHGKTWRDQLPDLGPGVHLIGPNTSYALYAYPC